MGMMVPPGCMSLRQMAELIGVSYETVRAEVESGRLRARMLRGSERGMFVTAAEVERWAAEETVEVAARRKEMVVW